MAMNFPDSPSLGQKYPQPPVTGQPVYTWDGEKWTTTSLPVGGGGVVMFMQDTPPTGMADGSFWLETDTGLLFFRWNDGNSTQWVALGTGTGNAVLTTPQTLNATQQTQALSNIGAISYNTQTLTTPQQVQANANIASVGYIAQTLTAPQQLQARANIGVMKKNYIVNGGMQISQENGTTAGTTTTFYPVDQFNTILSGGGTRTIQQVLVSTPGGSPNRIRVTVTVASTASSDFMALRQAIEGYRVADLRAGSASAKTITIQFGVKAPAGTYCVVVTNSGLNRCYITEYTIAAGEANTDVVKSVTLTLDTTGSWTTDQTAGLDIRFTLTAGASFQAAGNVWAAGGASVYGTSNQFNFMGTLNNVFELFDVGLYEGAVAPPFQVPDYATELTLCQRYYGRLSTLVGSAYGAAGGASYGTHVFPTMRTVPTVVASAQTYANASAYAVHSTMINCFRWSCTTTAAGQWYAYGDFTINARY